MSEQQNLEAFFRNVRARGVPLIAILSSDVDGTQAALVSEALTMHAEGRKSAPVGFVRWDPAGGITAVGQTSLQGMAERFALRCESVHVGYRDDVKLGEVVVAVCGVCKQVVEESRRVEFGLRLAQCLPEGYVLVLAHADLELVRPPPEMLAGIMTLRDTYKRDRQTLVIIGQSLMLPAHLSSDMVVYEEEMPSQEQYAKVIEGLCESIKQKVPDPETMTNACSALRGLSLFGAEQQTTLSLRTTGIDLSALWRNKKRVIDQSRFLTFYYDLPGFEAQGGCGAIKEEMRAALGSTRRPTAVLWLDEIEKAFAGASGEHAGGNSVGMDALGYFLWWSEQVRAMAFLFLGHPGTSKSYTAQCTAGEGHIPLLRADIGATRGMYVGDSEQNLRRMVRMAEAIAGGGERLLVIATCNNVAGLPEALLRRFRFGKYFFDLLDEQERLATWSIHRELRGLAVQDLPDDEGWTGAEIADCCEIAAVYGVSIVQASERIVPIAVQTQDKVRRLQLESSGKYLSASYAGVYRWEGQRAEQPKRHISLEE